MNSNLKEGLVQEMGRWRNGIWSGAIKTGAIRY